jgi:hypothetical protein
MRYVVDGNNSVAIGNNALSSAATGAAGSNNVAIGNNANPFGGWGNVAIGNNAMYHVTSGQSIAIGSGAMNSGSGTAVGNNALGSQQASGSNNAFGYQAGSSITTGVGNVLLGSQPALGLTTGNNNIVISSGWTASPILQTGSTNLLIGTGTLPEPPTSSTNNYINVMNTLFGDSATQSLGVGVKIPSAHLDIMAGSATFAPMHLATTATSSLVTTPSNGMLEASATSLYYTATSGIREPIDTSAVGSLNFNNTSSPLTLALTATGTYYKVSGSSLTQGSDVLNVTSTPSSGSLTVQTPGHYTVEYYLAAYSSAVGKFTGVINKNGTPVSLECAGEISMTATGASAVISTSKSCPLYLVPGDVITYSLNSSVPSTTATIEMFNLKVKK